MHLFLYLHYNSAESGCHGGERDAGAHKIFAMLSVGAVSGVEGGSLRGRLFAKPHGKGAQKKRPYGRCLGFQSEMRPQRTLERSSREPSGDQRMTTA